MEHFDDASEDAWLTVRDVAKHLKINEETVRRWIRTGELPALTLGRKSGHRVRRSDLATFIAQRYGAPAKAAA